MAGKITDKYDYEVETVKKTWVRYGAPYIENKVELHILNPFFKHENFIFCFKLIMMGLHKHKTIQIFNIVVKDSEICEVISQEECITN